MEVAGVDTGLDAKSCSLVHHSLDKSLVGGEAGQPWRASLRKIESLDIVPIDVGFGTGAVKVADSGAHLTGGISTGHARKNVGINLLDASTSGRLD